jgi:eukaryotic-like serine/threonine-protein kinase
MNNKSFKHKQSLAQWRNGFLVGVIVCLALLWLTLGLNKYYPVTDLDWFKLIIPALLLLSVLSFVSLLWVNRDKRLSQASKLIKTKKFDDAWILLQQCDKQEKLMPLLYQLATHFQKQQQLDKAINIYESIAEYAPDYRDVREQIKRHKAMNDTTVFGAVSAPESESHTLVLGGDKKATLGRYELEKEIGQGAMGKVYLGKDPKINRVVAIKTMALSQEFDEDELDDVKSRFFREAETAGRLTHPNIVTVYDVGEEHDLAYISMEYLDGHDLIRYTKPDKLLPVKTVLQLITLAAEALNYAHQLKVVHRDIKPANVMLIPAASTIKLTDFGIARITDSSKTKTGMVLGTPSYMSPEQLIGQRIDGRSDLFSLGVMLFQLLCGQLPFKGDSMAALMFSIANERHPEIIGIRKGLKRETPEISAIIDSVLQKTPQNRYQTGEELAKDLRNCLKNIKKNK